LLRHSIIALLLLASALDTAHGQSRRKKSPLPGLKARFRALSNKSGESMVHRAEQERVLREIRALGNENSLQFLAKIAGDKRHEALRGSVLRLMAGADPDSGIVAGVLGEHMDGDSPHRALARKYLLERAILRHDDEWLGNFFEEGSMEDRFLAVQAMGFIKSPVTVYNALALLDDDRWQPKLTSLINCTTLIECVKHLEGAEAARLLLRLRRDPRFGRRDAIALRDATRLWKAPDLGSYVRVADLAQPDARRRKESAELMGDAGIEAARAPLIFLARNRSERADVRAAAARALGGLKIARADLVQQLVLLLKEPDMTVRRGAVAGLGRLRVVEAVEALIDLLDDTALDPEARKALATAYGEAADFDWEAWLASPTSRLSHGT